MARLGAHIRFFIRKKMQEDPAWQKPTIIFSGERCGAGCVGAGWWGCMQRAPSGAPEELTGPVCGPGSLAHLRRSAAPRINARTPHTPTYFHPPRASCPTPSRPRCAGRG
jgi:hypothetical protein